MAAPELRLRAPYPGLLALPWDLALADWMAPGVALRDFPVGPSRHLVKFVESDGELWALKELPPRIAAREYDVLNRLEEMSLNAVRPAGLVFQPDFDTAILLTRYLVGSWQYRRLFMRLPPDAPKHRARLFDAMATLLVELHRHGVFWGDCSLANTLFSRDGQVLQASLVDAETSEIHPQLSDGQRTHDIDITVENVAAGLLDVAASLEKPQLETGFIEEALSIRQRYGRLWELLHSEPTFDFADRYRVEGTIRKLNELGFAVDEVSLHPVHEDTVGAVDQVRLHVTVGDRRYHATQLQRLSGLEVGEGQARILLGDLQAYQGRLCRRGRTRRGRPHRWAAMGHGGGHADDAPRACGNRGHRNSDAGLLRPARGAVAALRAGRPRCRDRASVAGPGGQGGSAGVRGSADGGRVADRAVLGAR